MKWHICWFLCYDAHILRQSMLWYISFKKKVTLQSDNWSKLCVSERLFIFWNSNRLIFDIGNLLQHSDKAMDYWHIPWMNFKFIQWMHSASELFWQETWSGLLRVALYQLYALFSAFWFVCIHRHLASLFLIQYLKI